MSCRLLVSLSLYCMGFLSTTAQAGLWDSQVEVAGQPAVSAGQTCLPADLPQQAMFRWPDNCSVVAPVEKASGALVEAVCRSGEGAELVIRRELKKSDDRSYTIVTTSRIERKGAAAQILPTTVLRSRYVGPCPDRRDAERTGRVERSSGVRMAGAAFVWIVQFLAFLGLVYASIRMWPWMIRRLARGRYAHATVANITTDQAGRAQIPVLATFSGVRGLPWWYAVATNNAKPLLVVAPDGLEFRVIRRRQRSWAEIECVDVRQAPGTVNLDVTFRDAVLTFSANLGAVPLAAHVLSLIPASVPLSDRAARVKAVAA